MNTSEAKDDLFRGKLLRLAAARDEDAAAMARWSEDAGYMRDLDTDYARPRPEREFSPEAYSQMAGPNSIEFRLRTLEDDRLVGFVALHTIEWNNRAAMLAIGIGEADYRGKGYGADALRLILRYAFDELNLERVGLDVIANNQAAMRAYERTGFRREGAMRRAVLRDGQAYDRVIMGILREEWKREGL
ncbi:MAG: GNAT family N-acetyltransferase [Anaerolineaceae bacterium]|nr:GNAT family N-acetyltransferase [Anaerolineaceae bacterium]